MKAVRIVGRTALPSWNGRYPAPIRIMLMSPTSPPVVASIGSRMTLSMSRLDRLRARGADLRLRTPTDVRGRAPIGLESRRESLGRPSTEHVLGSRAALAAGDSRGGERITAVLSADQGVTQVP